MLRPYRAMLASLALAGSLVLGASGALAAGATISTLPAAGSTFACQSGRSVALDMGTCVSPT